MDLEKYFKMYPYHFRSKHYVDAISFEQRVAWANWAHLRAEMKHWISEQGIDHWTEHNGLFMFAFDRDSIMFSLRWE